MKIKNAYIISVGILVICALVMFLYGIIFGPGDRGTTFALGQLVLEAALIPVAVFGFWYAAQEFQKGQRRPLLSLAWEDDAIDHLRETTAYFPRPKPGVPKGSETPPRFRQRIALYNTGENVAIWYSINLSFPPEMFFGREVPTGWNQDLMGLSGFYGETGDEYWIKKERPSTRDMIFQSNGTMASYPGQRSILGTLKFVPVPTEGQDKQTYQIRYKIYTEAGASHIDSLTLNIIWED